ncbi:cyclophilin-like fold protein [Streptomyces sp. NPDC005329]|uniref:cyclophilin-like fold protein n=1 Tax=Streptomyces sp. NPDC005329 TaxID=3157034 RepID=UPI0033BE0D77
MRIRLTVEETVLEATLDDHETARDFASLLPLTLRMHDLHSREKYGPLPKSLAEAGPRQHRFETGDIAYWSPGPDVAVFYSPDGPPVPDPGIVLLGSIGSGTEIFTKYDGPVEVTIEAIELTKPLG